MRMGRTENPTIGTTYKRDSPVESRRHALSMSQNAFRGSVALFEPPDANKSCEFSIQGYAGRSIITSCCLSFQWLG
jgi:hypothetical protein